MTNTERLLTLIMDVGEHMLRSGAEVHRTEESVHLMGTALGFSRIDVFIITSSMVVTAFTDGGEVITQTRRISSSTTDFEKLHRLNELSRMICAKKPDADTIARELELAVSAKHYPLVAEVVSYALVAGAFALFFGGGMAEAAVALVIGALIRVALIFSEKLISNKMFSRFLSSTIATALAYIALTAGLIPDVDKVMIGNIMLLIPGIGLTNALRDLFAGDSIAGLLRTVEAVLIALSIAAGYFAVTLVGGVLI